MINNTVKTAAGIRVMTDEAVKVWQDWTNKLRPSIEADHPMMRHSPNRLPWAHPGKYQGCSTWGEWFDHLGSSPSPDHYFVGG